MSDLDKTLSLLGVSDPALATAARQVQSQDGTTRADPSLTANGAAQTDFDDYSRRVDSLFGDKPAYQAVKHENPQHRMMLWHALRGLNCMESAAASGYTPQHVRTVRKQPWFREAFIRLSTEMGRDAVETFLEGEIVPTLQVLVDLRDNAESEAVRKSACDAILDRIRGKPTVKVEAKTSGVVDHIVHDATKLEEEYRRNAEILSSRGLHRAN